MAFTALALPLLAGSLLLWPAVARAEIEQRQVVSAITAVPGGDVLALASDTGCGGRQARMDAASLGLEENQYQTMKTQLAELIRNKTPLLMRLTSCPAPGGGGAHALPQVSKLGICEAQACADGKARLYLSRNLTRSEAREHALYALVLPLLPGKQAGTWQAEVFYVRPGEPRRLSALMDAPGFLGGRPVGSHRFYYPDGQVEMQVEALPDGQEIVQTFFPDGALALRGVQRHGKAHGVQQAYHENGQLLATEDYRDGKRIDGELETFDEHGKPRTRMTIRDGKTDGELLLFYPDGMVQSRGQFRLGKKHGPSTEYYPDGTVRRSAQYVDDVLQGQLLDFHPNGKLARQRQYGRGGVLVSDARFDADGAAVLPP